LTMAIAAIALNIALENVVRFIFGNDHRGYELALRRDWRLGVLRVGPQQVENLAIALVAMVAVFLFLAFTRTGKAMRAVADNPTLAGIKGIDADRVARLVNLAGMGLAGLFAAGAYASALVTVKLGLPIAVGLVAAALFAAATGAVMALTTRNLRGDYLAIVTLGFSEVVRLVASNEIWLTQGTDGISG